MKKSFFCIFTLLSLLFVCVPAKAAGDYVCMNTSTMTKYSTFAEGLNSLSDHDTLQLLSDISYETGIAVSGKHIKIELNGNNLTLTSSTTSGIKALDGGSIYIRGDGLLTVHVSGPGCYGLYASGGEESTIWIESRSEIIVDGQAKCGVLSPDDAGWINVNANITASSPDATGVYAHGTAFIHGNVTATACCVEQHGDGGSSRVEVSGDCIATGSDGVGVIASYFAEVTIGGKLKASKYMYLDGSYLSYDDYILPTTQDGYHTYKGRTTTPSTVWVAMGPPVCQVGTTNYDLLQDAITRVSDGGTINLLADIDYTKTIRAIKDIHIQLNSHTLTLTPAESGIIADDGALLSIEGYGTLKVFVPASNMAMAALNKSAINVSSTVKTTLSATDPNADTGVYASGGSYVTIRGDVTGFVNGISSQGAGSRIFVTGSVSSATDSSVGVLTQSGGYAKVNGSISAPIGVSADGSASTVDVIGLITATNKGIVTLHGATVILDGSITGPATYIQAGEQSKTKDVITTPTTKKGFFTYTDGASPANTVWIKYNPAIAQITATPDSMAYIGGSSTITLAGAEFFDGMTASVYYAGKATGTIATTTGDFNSQTVTLAFPANTSTTVDKAYVVKISDDGGSTWLPETVSISVTKKPLYTVTYDSQGGEPVPSQTVEADAYLPKYYAYRPGYTFTGWYREPACTNLWDHNIDKVTQNITLYAGWQLNYYTITFYDTIDGTDFFVLSNITFGTLISPPELPKKYGYIFKGWYTSLWFDKTWDFESQPVTGSMTLYGYWEYNLCSVYFDSKEGSGVLPYMATINETMPEPEPPVRDGYTFSGWYKDDEYKARWDFAHDTVTESITLFAKWQINYYTVTFKNLGSTVDKQTIAFCGHVKKPDNPVRIGYTFDGWSKDATYMYPWVFDSDMIPAHDITLYANWTKNQYTVSFDSQGGSASNNIIADYNSTITAPYAPTRIGYTFSGWYKEASGVTAWVFAVDTVPDHDIRLYAKWTINQYTVVFNSQGGSAISNLVSDYGSQITAPATPIRTTYDFSGWYKESACINAWIFSSDIITNNTILYAKWTARTPSASLAGINLSAGSLYPSFKVSVTKYTVNLKQDDNGIMITPMRAYDGAMMTINGGKVASKYISVANGKSATVTIKLAWGKTTKTYKLTIKRPKSTNNTLSSLKVSAGFLSPVFDSSTTSYKLELPRSTSKVSITAVKASSLAAVTPAKKTYTLKNGQTIKVTIKVKSQSGATKSYKIMITRAK